MPQVDNKTNSTMCYCPECGAATRMSYHLPEDCKTIQKLKQQLERSRGETDRIEGKYDVVQQQLAEARGRAERAEQLVFGEFVGYQAYIAECNFILDEDNEEPILNDPVCEQTAGECIKKFFAAIEAAKGENNEL